ncbi:MAG: hypothetical protein HDT40_03675 [Lachnospiraceae bacterium]|nr:hypothetical protein [Lachnospiraceae bacterium]
MSKEKAKTTKDENSLVDDNITQFLVEEAKKIAKEDFVKFSAIATLIFSLGLWIIKSIWYVYWSGKFSVYRIDECYINADNENIFLQIIQLVSIYVVWMTINYGYYKIAIAEDKSKWHLKRKLKKFVFCLTEIAIVFFLASILNNSSIFEIFDEITVEIVIAYIVVGFLIYIVLNMYAIVFLIVERIERKNISNENVKKKITKEQLIKEIIFYIIVTVAIELIVIFIVAKQQEYNKCDYKVIVIKSEELVENEFQVIYKNNHDKYQIFPIVYENQDCYIVTRLYNDNGKIKIDYNYQRIIEKKEQEVIYVDNVYKINADK